VHHHLGEVPGDDAVHVDVDALEQLDRGSEHRCRDELAAQGVLGPTALFGRDNERR
jgi:hypothetical protein